MSAAAPRARESLRGSLQESSQETLQETRTTCCYCGVGCGVIVQSHTDANGAESIVGVRGDPQHPANFGKLCSKGSALHLSAAPHRYAQTRAAHPELRGARAAPRQRVSWDAALEHVAQRLLHVIAEHGPDALGIYVSGQLLTEDYYVFNKLAKGLIGTNHIDSNSRLCMSSAVTGYKAALGADAPPCSYEDIEHASVVFIAGANPAFAHPVLYRRLEAARTRRPDIKVIVADPRRTDTAAEASLHLPLRPGTDVALLNAMLHVMVEEDLIAHAYVEAHTRGFDAVRASLRELPPAEAARLCGLRLEDILAAARWFAQGPTLSLYCQGLNQSSAGTDKNTALINLHLACAQIGRPGAGPFSLTGQPNAMGGREVGGMATLGAAHRDLSKPHECAQTAQFWGVPSVPATPGRTALEMFEALAEGSMKAIWIVCTNPAQSMPDQRLVRAGLERAAFVVLQEAYAHTATARYADVLLPATTWGEKDGTVTNSERRISRVRSAVAPFGASRHDWRIATDVARRMESTLRPGRPSLFPYESAETIWNEHRATTAGRDLDIGGLSWPLLETQGPQQWPFPPGARQGAVRLYTDGIFPTPDGHARLNVARYRPVADAVDARYPFALNTGRLRDQWHGMSRTGTVAQSFAHAPLPGVDLNPGDLRRLGLTEGSLAHITSRRASVVLPVRGDAALQPGQAFLPMHWGDEFVCGTPAKVAAQGVNALTCSARDPQSHQPELKHAAVKILRAELPWRWTMFGYFPASSSLALQQALRPYLRRFPYASCTLFDAERNGVLWHAADYEAAPASLRETIETLFGLPPQAADVLAYGDKKHGTTRRARCVAGVLSAVSLAGAHVPTEQAAAWLRATLERGAALDAAARRRLLTGKGGEAGGGPASKTICTCLGVGERAIAQFLAQLEAEMPLAERLARLQAGLKCGTQCGSCVPELRRMSAPPNGAGAPTMPRPSHA